MNYNILMATVLAAATFLLSCGDSGSSTPTAPTPATTTTAAPTSRFETTTLVTVYRKAADFARFTEGTMMDDDATAILLGVDEVTPGTTVLDNELLRFELQAAIDRINAQFSDEDFVAAFDETKENLRRFFNDADNDGWSVDGRHGEGRDWPHDRDGNDPDGWTAQMVITVTRR